MYWMIFLLAVIGYIIWQFLEDEYNNPLNKLPGPPRKPIVGCIYEFMKMDLRSLFLKMREYAKVYGDRYVIKILNRRILHILNVKDVELVLSHSKNIKKSKPYKFLEAWLGTGLLLSTGTKWHSRRKILTPAFHFNILKSFSIMMEERSRALVEKMKTLDGTEISLLPIISECTLLTICETAMGTQLDSDKSVASVEYKNAIAEIGSLLLSRLTRIWLHNEFIFRKLPIGRQFEKCLYTVHSFADNMIMERKKTWKPREGDFSDENIGTKKRLAMLDLLLEAENKGKINLEGIREEVNTFMFEGHDTTAMAIVFALMMIADHELIQERIYEEVLNVLEDSNRSLTMSKLADLKYLEAVIKETLRLYPSVPFIAREITEDFMLDDLPVKKGTEVAIHIYDLHRRADLYPNPEQFNPERFLTGEVVHPYAFVPFSAGPRNCIGQRFAMLEMKFLLSGICRNFKLRPHVKGARPTLLADMLLRPAEPIIVKIDRR